MAVGGNSPLSAWRQKLEDAADPVAGDGRVRAAPDDFGSQPDAVQQARRPRGAVQA